MHMTFIGGLIGLATPHELLNNTYVWEVGGYINDINAHKHDNDNNADNDEEKHKKHLYKLNTCTILHVFHCRACWRSNELRPKMVALNGHVAVYIIIIIM